MKRIIMVFGLLSMLLVTNAVVALGAKYGAMTDAALQGKLEALERKVWEGFKAQDIGAIKQVIAAEAMATDMMGVSPASQIETMLKDIVIESYSLQDFKLVRLDRNAAVLLYTATQSGKFQGQAIPMGPYYCSTAFVERGGKWVALHHQETLAATHMVGEAAEKK